MLDQKWTQSEKKVARQAFDLAHERESQAVLREIRSMLNSSKDLNVIWRVHDYLGKKRREMDGKYDFRYSQMMFIFASLLRDGWLTEEDLEGLSEQKLEALRRLQQL